MTDPMQEIRASFFIECEELLENLQDALQSLDEGLTDAETINIAFRAVHSIKGGAGAFGLDRLVAFAHQFETAMDELRAGRLAADVTHVQLFFQCADALSDLVRAARDESDLPEEATAGLIAQLAALTGATERAGHAEPTIDFAPAAISLDLPGLAPLGPGATEEDATALAHWRVVFAPAPELYRSANEPLYILRGLAALGEASCTCEIATPPDLAAFDGTAALFAWTVELATRATEQEIREVFEFAAGLCRLEITREMARDDETELGLTDGPPTGPETIRPAEPEPPGPERRAAPRGPAQVSNTVRVDLDRVDRLVNLVGELVINQAMLAQSITASGMAGSTAVSSGLDEFQQLTRDIQDSVMMIRAQPVKSLFQRMARIVREASADIGKTVRLQTEGDATEIDKTMIERMADPLTHMIRNAVDHGLETTEARRAAGKPAEGRVQLSASHRSGRVVIEVRDDGGGIDRAKVRSVAEKRGLIAPSQDLSEAEIDALLFQPGFSTASQVSNLSGRGVGMDVVKNAIAALGGRITIQSVPAKGTTFSISLPLTLAVLDGMVVRTHGETLVVPINAIVETLALRQADVTRMGGGSQAIKVRDRFLPLIDLGAELGYAPPRNCYDGAIVLLVANEDGRRAAVVVDTIEDQRQVVIKGLQDSYGHVPGVAAATILGDGQIALILDPADLLANAAAVSRPALSMTGT